mgnify:CR=1 FL=1
MPKVTFTTKSVVCVHIKGEEDKSPRREGEPNLPRCLDDGGLVEKFLKFQADERVHPVAKMPCGFGDGEYFGFFAAKDVPKIKAWLLGRGVGRENR